MHDTLYESVVTFLVLAGVALYVALRRERSGVYWLLLTLLVAIMAWNGGLAVFWLLDSGSLARAGLTVAFVGVFIVPPCWLLLAARHTHLRFFDERPGWLIAVLVPPAMTCLAVVTNSGHRLFVRDLSRSALQGAATTWAGPIFWIGLGFGILMLLVGVGLYLGTAWRMVASGQTRRGLLLASIVTFPLVLSPLIGIYARRDFSPILLGLMSVLLFAVNWRHRVLETLPIARRDVIEQLPEAVILADSDGIVLDLNPAAEKLVGVPATHLRRQSLELVIADLAVPSDREEVESAMRRLIASGAPAHLELRSNGERAFELHAAAVVSGDGELAGYYALLRDRTEHHRYEHFLRQSHRLEIVASLTRGVAHEVNNPLAFVRSNLNHIRRTSEMLAERLKCEFDDACEDLDELRQAAEESLEGIDRVTSIVGRMGRFSLIQSGDLGSVDINAVVEDALRVAQFRAGPEIEIQKQLISVVPPVHGSTEHLVQAVLNLIVNARQALAGRRDGQLRVATRRTREGIEVRVADNGPGIPVEIQDRIFDPTLPAKGEEGVSRLGLAIASGIVREHRGVLDLESSSSHGTEFVIRLPIAQARGARATGSARAS